MTNINANILNNNGILHRPSTIQVNPKGFGAEIFETMKKFQNNIVHIDALTGKGETYGEVLEKSVRVALELETMNLSSEDVICLCTYNHLEMSLPIWAANFNNIPIGFLDPSLYISDMKYCINLLQPKIIFTVSETVETIENALKELNLEAKLVVFGETRKHIPFRNFLKDRVEVATYEPKVPKSLHDTICILFSSGTSGLPKGVCLSHYGMIHNNISTSLIYPLETTLFYSNPYWLTYLCFTTATMISGGKRIICKTIDETKVLKYVQDYKVSFLFLPPAYTFKILSDPKNFAYNTSDLAVILIGGAPFGTEQMKRIKELFPKTVITNSYGITEITGVVSAFNCYSEKYLLETKIGSCGNIALGITCKVVDIETNKICRANERGELLLKTKSLFTSYYKNPEGTKNTFDEDGYFRTGDVVYYDEDYCLYVVDRIKDLMKYQSWQIAPTELESVLKRHPFVKEAIVIGVPDEQDGDHPAAIIELKTGVSVTENDIHEFYNKQVDDRKKLRGGIKLVQNIPKTTSGKYSRRSIKDKFLKNDL